MANSANTNSVSGIAALINVQKPSSSAEQQGERKVLPGAPAEGVKAYSGNQQRNNSGQDDNMAKDSSFSRLITSDAKDPVRSVQRTATATTPVFSTSTPATAVAQESDETTEEAITISTETTFSSIMLVLIQLQNIPQKNASELSPGYTPKADAANDTANQIAGSLEDLITKLIALLEQLGGEKPASATAATQIDIAVIQQVEITSSTTVIQTVSTEAQASPALPVATEADNTANTNVVDMSEIMAMLQSMLQQPGASKAAATPINTTVSADDIAIADATKEGAAKIPSGLTEALGKLADLLEQTLQPQKATKSTVQDIALPAKAPAEGTTASDITLPITPKPEPAPLSSITPERNEFQQVLARLGAILAPKDETANDTASANTITPAVAYAPQQNVQESSFARIVQQPAAQSSALPPQDQVLVNIKNAVADGLSQIKIQLHPEELGKVEVHLTTTADGKTGISITADNRQTLSMLQNEARALQDALRDIGLKTDAGSLNFNLRDSQQDARNSSKQQQGGYTQVAGVDDIEEPAYSTAGALYRLSVQNGLDIRV